MKKLVLLALIGILIPYTILAQFSFGGGPINTPSFWKLTGTVLSPADDNNSLSVGDMVVTGNVTGALDMNGEVITNIGNAGTDFNSSGGLTVAANLSAAGDRFYLQPAPTYPGTDLRLKGTSDDGSTMISFWDHGKDLTVAGDTSYSSPPFAIDYDPADEWSFGAYSGVISVYEGTNSTAKAVLVSEDNGIALGTDGTNALVFIGNDNWDGFYANLKTTNLTASKDFQFPNISGTLVTTAGAVADVNLGDGHKLITDEVRAYDAAGLKLYDDGGNGIFVKDGGNVGIGTTTPDIKLQVVGSVNPNVILERTTAGVSAQYNTLRLLINTTGDAVDNLGSQLEFAFSDSGASNKVLARIAGIRDGADTEGALLFKAGTNGIEEFMRISNDGDVGIGVAGPASILDIDKGTGYGQVTLNGSSGGCLMLRDTDDAGWTECSALNGTLTCTVDADGICDGS